MNKIIDSQAEDIEILCFNIKRLPRSVQFVILIIITFVFFLLYGYMQELIFKLPGLGESSWYLTLVQFFLYTVFALIETVLRGDLKRRFVYIVQFYLKFFFFFVIKKILI